MADPGGAGPGRRDLGQPRVRCCAPACAAGGRPACRSLGCPQLTRTARSWPACKSTRRCVQYSRTVCTPQCICSTCAWPCPQVSARVVSVTCPPPRRAAGGGGGSASCARRPHGWLSSRWCPSTCPSSPPSRRCCRRGAGAHSPALVAPARRALVWDAMPSFGRLRVTIVPATRQQVVPTTHRLR